MLIFSSLLDHPVRCKTELQLVAFADFCSPMVNQLACGGVPDVPEGRARRDVQVRLQQSIHWLAPSPSASCLLHSPLPILVHSAVRELPWNVKTFGPSCGVLDSFCQLDTNQSPSGREPQLRDCLHQIGPWMCL